VVSTLRPLLASVLAWAPVSALLVPSLGTTGMQHCSVVVSCFQLTRYPCSPGGNGGNGGSFNPGGNGGNGGGFGGFLPF
jgi:hypothetical protein